MPRLFTALEIPAEIGARLSILRGGLPGARWVEPENYHITLRFLGDVDDRVATDAAELLDGISRQPLKISVAGVDAFGGERPRAVFARVEPDAALIELQAEQERVLRRAGLAPEGRKYTPHITLARLRDVKPRDVAEWLATRGGAPKMNFDATRFVLMSSRANSGGGPYVVEEAYPLGQEDMHAQARW